ncbi:choice-of-anchor Q domain-containing protein [Amycolatopsis sp. NPDC059021]|uniref:choice-of-anchor Q domain-containing protein n=1 Tax=Amycolatopsis sp. NPDC059021 TaxID=3346704 RepID=UPI00366E4E61
MVLFRAGKPDSWITFVSEPPHAAMITGRFALQREYVRVAGFNTTGPGIRDGMDVTASNTVIQGNEFHDIHKFEPSSDGGSGLTVFTDDYEPLENVIVDGNHVYDIGLSVGDNELVQGIYISVPCKECAVVNNLVHQVADFGIHSYHRPRDWLVANNTVFNNGRGILADPDFTVINNISFDHQRSNYDIRGPAAISHNLSFGRGSAKLTGVTVADPRFVNYQADGSGDYHLTAGSPGIDCGTAEKAPTHDIDGRTRPQGKGYDIGVYEQ